jgi:hypothetical protein
MPWLRLDALMLNIVWVLPRFSQIATRQVSWAWITAACFIPVSLQPACNAQLICDLHKVSFGWAAGKNFPAPFLITIHRSYAGDVSLAAYIQSSLSGMDLPDEGVSPLGAVMSFLYSGVRQKRLQVQC